MLIIEIPLKPMGRNHSHKITTINGFPRMIKTSKCRQFESEMDAYLLKHLREIKAFTAKYDEYKHQLKASLTLYGKMLTKDKNTKQYRISKKSFDVDSHKVALDVMCKRLCIDDSQIMDWRVIKKHSEKTSMVFCFELEDLGFTTG